MRFLPSSKDGWIIAYIALIAVSAFAVWAFTGKDLPAGIKELAFAVVTGFFAVLRNTPEPKPGSTTTVDASTTTTTPPEPTP